MKNKILILGSTGMAGHVIKKYLNNINEFEIYDLARSDFYFKPYFKQEVTNFEKLNEIIHQYSFDYIINCVGLLSKPSEDNPDLAILLNAYLPHFIERTTKDTKTKIIHISTDCVFSGKKGDYKENDLTDGTGFYAQSKALGEIINDKDLTIRTSIIGPELNLEGVGLFNWFVKQNGQIYGYANAYWSGITTLELAKNITEIILNKTSVSGLLHLTNNSKISKHQLLLNIQYIFNLKNINIIESNEYKVDKSLLNSRDDINLNIPSYSNMILELMDWMNKNKY
jgi:dTDP-4-dehydrorhamnose reductase